MQRSEGYEQHKRLTCNDYDKKKKKNSLRTDALFIRLYLGGMNTFKCTMQWVCYISIKKKKKEKNYIEIKLLQLRI